MFPVVKYLFRIVGKLGFTGKNMFLYHWDTQSNKIVFTDKIYVSTSGKFVPTGRKKKILQAKYISTLGKTIFDRQKYLFQIVRNTFPLQGKIVFI